MLSPSERRLRARIGAFALHASGRTNTRAAYAARIAKLEAEVDPTGSLPAEERARRVRLALQAQMARLSLRASRARSRPSTAPEAV